MTISERIKLIRGSLSQSDFGAQIGVSQSAVQNYESGQIPKGDVLQRIRQKFKVNIDWLLTGEGKPYIEREGREVFETGGIELQDGEGPWGKTREHDVEGAPPLTVTAFEPKDDQVKGPLRAAMEGLGEIFDSNDPILIPAIQANIHAARISVQREYQNTRQAQQIKDLEDKNDEFKKRLEDLERKSEDNPGHNHKEVPTKQKAI